MRERLELRLDLFGDGHGGRRILARLARRIAELAVVLRQRRRRRANLFEVALQRPRLPHRVLDLVFRRAQLRPQLVEGRAFFLQRVERRLRLQRLRRQLLDGLTVFAQLSVGADGLFGGLLRLPCRLFERLNSLVDVLELPGALVERRQPARDFVEPRRRGGRLLRHLLERLAHGHELRTARLQRHEHLGDCSALFARGGDQPFEFLGGFLCGLSTGQ